MGRCPNAPTHKDLSKRGAMNLGARINKTTLTNPTAHKIKKRVLEVPALLVFIVRLAL